MAEVDKLSTPVHSYHLQRVVDDFQTRDLASSRMSREDIVLYAALATTMVPALVVILGVG